MRRSRAEAMDEVTKRREYAAAGIAHYWVINRDAALTAGLNRLGSDGEYEEYAKMPLAWLLQTAPGDHLG
ncbi:hypothetical protein ACQP00_43985 [Dactylosporangium sp. CS-047395]|uniref:hypothetical protein n=1 Tax=Dactylosporangium sp. CS-047395 TaxID=3239936 RepID=UPI003D8EF373